jgi:hypothetical protein
MNPKASWFKGNYLTSLQGSGFPSEGGFHFSLTSHIPNKP